MAMFVACRNARDRLIVLLVGRAGLRRGPLAGLRRSDVHLLPDSRVLGRDYPGAPVRVSAFDLYYEERNRLLGSGGSDFPLVNLFGPCWES
ncbi:hypothetical protein [Streptomyces sp. 4N124]|uniref:hypothetical protein n=1 Tax=Streptomyces sp. 4N124 TaxID=3457420 RepID=UPI003FD23BD7